MGEILPDGTIQGYQGYCKNCGSVINVNEQGSERIPYHLCQHKKLEIDEYVVSSTKILIMETVNSEQKTSTTEKAGISFNPLLSAVISDCTHLLACRHCIGRSCRDYYMDCIVLGETKNGKMKIIVFGVRDWKGKEHIKRIKYVDKWKLYPK